MKESGLIKVQKISVRCEFTSIENQRKLYGQQIFTEFFLPELILQIEISKISPLKTLEGTQGIQKKIEMSLQNIQEFVSFEVRDLTIEEYSDNESVASSFVMIESDDEFESTQDNLSEAIETSSESIGDLDLADAEFNESIVGQSIFSSCHQVNLIY